MRDPPRRPADVVHGTQPVAREFLHCRPAAPPLATSQQRQVSHGCFHGLCLSRRRRALAARHARAKRRESAVLCRAVALRQLRGKKRVRKPNHHVVRIHVTCRFASPSGEPLSWTGGGEEGRIVEAFRIAQQPDRNTKYTQKRGREKHRRDRNESDREDKTQSSVLPCHTTTMHAPPQNNTT